MAPDKGTVSLDSEFQKDIKWFSSFLTKFNGKVFLYKTLQPPITDIYVDASLQGLGGVWDNQVYAVLVDSYYNSMNNINIVHLEIQSLHV